MELIDHYKTRKAENLNDLMKLLQENSGMSFKGMVAKDFFSAAGRSLLLSHQGLATNIKCIAIFTVKNIFQ